MPPAKSSAGKSEDPKKADDAKKTVEPTPPASTTPADENAPVVPAQETPNHDETDVAAALQRKTQDGKGTDEVPEPNFESFATEGVEQKKSDQDIAHEVLEGKWGYSRAEAFAKMRAEGLDAIAISDEVKRLLDAGKPSTLSD